jgi:hypothetical protein
MILKLKRRLLFHLFGRIPSWYDVLRHLQKVRRQTVVFDGFKAITLFIIQENFVFDLRPERLQHSNVLPTPQTAGYYSFFGRLQSYRHFLSNKTGTFFYLHHIDAVFLKNRNNGNSHGIGQIIQKDPAVGR